MGNQSIYDEWYKEGYEPSYGDIVIKDPDLDTDFTYPTYPNQSWGNIDGKDYYYCAHLYESITIL